MYYKLHRKLTSDQIREAMQDKPKRSWRPRRWMYYAATVLVIGLWVWILATDQVGAAIDQELDRVEQPIASATLEEVQAADSVPFTATAYSWECGTGDNLTASMTPVREGVIAVDPNTIPLGSTVEIVGLGMFSAEDVGGLIKGNRVDIFMPSRSAALNWGVREVEVRVVE